MGRKSRVLVVDDSRSMGQFLSTILSQDPELEVVGHALDPYEARDLIKQLDPDVLTLDVRMPRMDGITFLRNLMRLRPMPVVMLSSLTGDGAEVTLDALALGAVDFVLKRQPSDGGDMNAYARDIRERVRNAAASANSSAPSALVRSEVHNGIVGRTMGAPAASRKVHRIVAIGASTGGPAAVGTLFEKLALDDSCAILSQHMPAHFMGPFAHRLNLISNLTVVLAADGQTLSPGHVYVAPGDMHLTVRRVGDDLINILSSGAKRHDHRPAVDVMFESAAQVAGASVLGILLTGMGQDGAKGMCAIRRAGGLTIAQDEATSVVWGMPGSAVNAGGAEVVLPLDDIAGLASDVARRPARTNVLNHTDVDAV